MGLQKERITPSVSFPSETDGRGIRFSDGTRGMPESVSESSKIAKTFDAIMTVSLTALFFGFPIFFTGVTFQGVVFEKQLYFYFWILIGLVAWVSKGVVTGEMRIRRTPLDIPIMSFLAAYGLSTVFSINRWESFWGSFGDPSRGFLSILSLAFAYYLVASHCTEKRIRTMFWSLLVSSGIVVIWSFFVVMGIRFLPASVEAIIPFSLFGTVTTLTLFLSVAPVLFLTAIFALFEGDTSDAKWRRWTAVTLVGIALVLDLFLLLALSPFVSWAVVVGGVGFLLIYVLAQIVRPAGQLTWIPMALFVIVLAFLMIDEVDIARVNLPVEVIPKVSFALETAKEAVGHDFLLGAGPASYAYVFSMYRPAEYNLNSLFTLRFDQAPGLVMEALSTIGILGTIAYLVLVLAFIGIGIYLLSSGRSRNKIYSLGLLSASVMFFIASFMSAFNGPIVLLSSLIGMLAMASLLWESGVEDHSLNLSFKASPKFALALAFIFMVVSAGVAFLFVFIGKVFVADVAAGRALRSEVVSEDSIRPLLQAIRMYPQEPQYRVQLGQRYIALANAEAAKPSEEGDVNLVVEYIRQAIAQTESAWAIAPNSVRVAESLGLVYENSALYTSEALSKALESYEAADRLEPNSPILPVKIGQVKRAMGEREKDENKKRELFEEARDQFREAVGRKENFPIGYYNLAVALSRLGEYTEAIDELSKAVVMEPSDSTYLYSLGSLYQLRKEGDDLEKAEAVYGNLLSANERLVDVRLALGLLHEERGDTELALAEYRKILEYLPEDDGNSGLREQVETFIEGIESGRGNLAGAEVPELPEPGAESVIPLQTEEGLVEQEDEASVAETVPVPEIPSVEEED